VSHKTIVVDTSVVVLDEIQVAALWVYETQPSRLNIHTRGRLEPFIFYYKTAAEAKEMLTKIHKAIEG